MRLLAQIAFLSGVATVAVADDTGLPVPPEEASVVVRGRLFDIFAVDDETARQRTDEFRKLLGGTDLADCRVVRAVEHGRSNAPVFFLGMCRETFRGYSQQTGYCLNTQSDDYLYLFGQSGPDLSTPSELVASFNTCVLEDCAGDSCR